MKKNLLCKLHDSRRALRRGQLLIEMLVALGILTVGFLGVTTLLSRAIGLNRVVSDNYTATYLAEEGIEVAKNILDGNKIQGLGWNQGLSGDFEIDAGSKTMTPWRDRYLTLDPITRQYGYGAFPPTVFKRKITGTLSGTNELVITSLVTWVSRGGSYSVNLEDHFFNWR